MTPLGIQRPRDEDSPATQPLTGVRVLEFGHVASAPFATCLLADLGADVVKVEPPSGDQMRGWPPFSCEEEESFSHSFAALNRNKRSVSLDLNKTADLTSACDLASLADVLVVNYRPNSLDRFGLGFESLRKDHRGLVYCSITGFGRRSPYATWGAYDVLIQAMSGLMSITGDPDGEPAKSGVPVADFICGLYAAFTITALLESTRDAGRSHYLDCSMLDCLLAASALQTSSYWGSGEEPSRMGSAHPRNAPYQAFPASDGSFVVAAGSQRLWGDLCRTTGLEHLIDDPRFSDQPGRVTHQVELAHELAATFRTATVAEWVARLTDEGIPAGPVNTYPQILADPHMTMTDLAREVPMPGGANPAPQILFPVLIDDFRAPVRTPSPLLGEHTASVLADWASLR